MLAAAAIKSSILNIDMLCSTQYFREVLYLVQRNVKRGLGSAASEGFLNMKYSLFMMSPCILHPHQDLCAWSYDFSEGHMARFFNWRKG